MPTYLAPVLFTLFLWWFSTGAILYAVGLAARRPARAAAFGLLLLAASAAAFAATRDAGGVAAAYLGFTAAILFWGAHELSFLAGWITGPWRARCPAGLGPWARMRYAIAAILHHELALVLSAAALFWLARGPAQALAAWTFGALLLMRVSAQLNVFLGVSNLADSFLPARLDYLKSFFARRPMNVLFPVSVSVSAIVLALLVDRAANADPATAASLALLATLVALGLLEHWFLVLPLPVEALWRWALRGRTGEAGTTGEAGAENPASGGGATVVRLEAHLARLAARRPGGGRDATREGAGGAQQQLGRAEGQS